MSVPTAEVVICGAGIAGIAAAYHLAVRRGNPPVIPVRDHPPPPPPRDNAPEADRRLSAAPPHHFPARAERAAAPLPARRGGWFSGQQLGMYMLERAREAGVRLTEGRVDAVETAGGRVTGVRVSGGGGRRTIGTPRFVNAAGPHVKAVGRLLDVEIPVFCERHAKVAFHDTQGVVPRHAPMMIWTDPVRLAWSDDEREELGQAEGMRHLLEDMPAGVHGRPEGGGDSPLMLGVWTYDVEPMEPRSPVEIDPP